MFRKLFLVILLGSGNLCFESSATAQDRCSYWFGEYSCQIDGNMVASPLVEARDFFSTGRGVIFPWKPSVDKDAALGLQLLQKPRFILWLQPIQRSAGFKLFFEF
jgi:hypothetical protein